MLSVSWCGVSDWHKGKQENEVKTRERVNKIEKKREEKFREEKKRQEKH